MKKHNEGYSLVLVLVVLTVLSLVASFILSFSLRNLQSQTASVERMEHKYAAAGEIERIVARLEMLIGDDTQNPVTLTSVPYLEEDTWKIDVVSKYESVQINCTLRLTGATVANTGTENQYNITGLTAVDYLSYETSVVETTAEEGGATE